MDASPRRLRLEVIDDTMAHVYRAMGGVGRLRVAMELFESARTISGAGVRQQHPDWNEHDVRHEVARRFLNAAD